jgi:DNA-directed RNA polymerase specialized sigma subunit
MVDKIVYTYKFNTLPNVDSLKEECKIWLVTILEKFDPSKGHKAFSYFSVITKNWFIQKTKKNKSKLIREVELENIHTVQEKLIVENQYHNLREKEEFFTLLSEEVQKWKELNLRENELRVLEAVQILFDERENIEIFNKKAIYLYLREITGMNTKQIVNNLNKIRQRYRVFKARWDDGEL